jgi:hypothetical protein
MTRFLGMTDQLLAVDSVREIGQFGEIVKVLAR